MVERQPSKLNVAGSNPVSRSKTLSERLLFGVMVTRGVVIDTPGHELKPKMPT